MGSRITHIIKTHRGVPIYRSANTHPNSKTTAIIIFRGDVIKDATGTERFRYARRVASSYTAAMCEALQYINKHVSVRLNEEDMRVIQSIQISKARAKYKSFPAATKTWIALRIGASVEWVKKHWEEIIA